MPFEQPVFPVPTVTSWPSPRAIREDEWASLRIAVNEVFRFGGGDLFRDSPLLFDPGNREHLRVIVDERRGGETATTTAPARPATTIVAHAGFVTRDVVMAGKRRRVACVGGVFTAAGQRRQGLGSRVLQDVLRQARKEVELVMVSGDRDLYRRQGLRPVPPLMRFVLRAPPEPRAAAPSIAGVPWSTAPLPRGIEVRPATKGDLETMARLYDAEDVHFIRSGTDWVRLWEAGCLVDAPAVFSVVLREGVMSAYVVAQREGRRANGAMRGRRILEIAGERQAILDVAPALADDMLVPPYDAATVGACERRGWRGLAHAFAATVEAVATDVPVIPWYGLNYL